MAKVVSHMTMSLDGFIADPQDGADGTLQPDEGVFRSIPAEYVDEMGVDLVPLGTTGTL